MNLRWRQFEERMRARVGQYDARRRMRFWQKVVHFFKTPMLVPLWLGRTCVSVFFAVIVLTNRAAIPAHQDLVLAGLSLWVLLAALMRAEMLQNTAQIHPEFRALWMLPLTANRIFGRWIRHSSTGCLWLLFEVLLVYCLLPEGSPPLAGWWAVALVCAGLQVALSVGMALWLAGRQASGELVLVAMGALGMLAIFTSQRWVELFLVPALSVANPFGWLSTFYLHGCLRGDARAWWLVVPVVVLLASLRAGLRPLRRLHDDGVFRIPRPRRPGLVAIGDEPAPRQAVDRDEQRHQARSGGYSKPLDWASFGTVERLIARGLTRRERLVAETLILSQPRWTRHFLGVLVYFTLYLVANTQILAGSLEDLVGGIFRPGTGDAVSVIAFFAGLGFFAMTLTKVASLLLEFGAPEFVSAATRNVSPGYSAFRLLPLNYWEVARTRTKIITLLMLALLPLVVLFSFSPSCVLVFPSGPHAPALVIKSWVLVWGVHLLLSSVSLIRLAPSGPRYWTGLLRALLVLLVALVVGTVALASSNLLGELFLTGLFLAGALAWFLYCGGRYRNGPR